MCSMPLSLGLFMWLFVLTINYLYYRPTTKRWMGKMDFYSSRLWHGSSYNLAATDWKKKKRRFWLQNKVQPDGISMILSELLLLWGNSLPLEEQIPSKSSSLISISRSLVRKCISIQHFNCWTHHIGAWFSYTCQQRLYPTWCCLTVRVQECKDITLSSSSSL